MLQKKEKKRAGVNYLFLPNKFLTDKSGRFDLGADDLYFNKTIFPFRQNLRLGLNAVLSSCVNMVEMLQLIQ